ncbi:MAG: helix-turn-helix domain-containing protein [Gammaproteobacteria bacterium]|nr:helix-turn-helix domain-containing protein [Gammaproteobacteria bacterium]
MSETIQSATKVLKALDILLPHFAHGLTGADVARELRVQPPVAHRYLVTLEEAGFAERIQETGRWRASHRLGRAAVAIMDSLRGAENAIHTSVGRLTGGRQTF